MVQNTTIYRKMPGKRLALFGSSSLWQAADHLLWVEGSIMHERYKRFYYYDIQAVVMARSSRRTLFAVLWGGLALLFGAVSLFFSGASGPPYVSATFTMGFTVLFAINFLLGDSCDVYIQTAVQLERISSLVRVPKAEKVLDRIRIRVEHAQGVFHPPSAENVSGVIAEGPPSGGPATSGRNRPISDFKPTLYWILFGLLAVMGLLRGVQIWLKSIALAGLDIFVLAASLVLVIIVLVRWYSHVKGTMVSVVSWLTAVFVVVHCIVSYVLFIAANMLHPQAMYNYGLTFKYFFEMQMDDHMGFKVYAICVAVLSMVFGLWGGAAVSLIDRQRIVARDGLNLMAK